MTPFVSGFLDFATVFIVLIGIVFGANEFYGYMPLEYSKFGHSASFKVPSKVGMFILYFPATIVPVFLVMIPNLEFDASFSNIMVFLMIVMHFGKRCLEVLYLHKFSGSDGIISVGLITSSYLLVAVSVVLATTANREMSPVFWLGVILYFLGEGGNFYHHYLLANLRKPGDTAYKVPTGGLFDWICCPHYLCEILAWYGVMLALPCNVTLASCFAFTVYLTGRAKQTLLWYRSKNLPIPLKWKALVPNVF